MAPCSFWKGYLRLSLVTAWLAGTLHEQIRVIRTRARRPLNGLDAAESIVLRWLASENV